MLTHSAMTIENDRANPMAKLDAHDGGWLVRAAERIGVFGAPDPHDRRAGAEAAARGCRVIDRAVGPLPDRLTTDDHGVQ